MRVAQHLSWQTPYQRVLDLARCLARGDPGTIAQPENVGIDRHRRFTERDVQNHIGGLASHAG